MSEDLIPAEVPCRMKGGQGLGGQGACKVLEGFGGLFKTILVVSGQSCADYTQRYIAAVSREQHFISFNFAKKDMLLFHPAQSRLPYASSNPTMKQSSAPCIWHRGRSASIMRKKNWQCSSVSSRPSPIGTRRRRTGSRWMLLSD